MYAMMYSSQKHASNLTYPSTPPAWYSNYPSHHHPNNQFLNAAPSGPNGILDTDSTAASTFYNAHHHHHHMLHSSSPDWVHDNYNLSTSNSQFFSNGMTPPTPLHLSPTIQSHLTTTSNSTTANDHLTNGMANNNIPPSPPITVNSACSEMSSPGIGSNGNGGSGGSGGGSSGTILGSSGDVSPNLTSNNDLSRPKSPYGWLKKNSYQNQTSSGKTRTKDKYRVVYTDYQRCELEKEYHMAHYITIRRKSELAQVLQLSERQVKIWFQNRRAKDRKQTKKRDCPVGGSAGAMLSNSCANVGIPLSHHHHHHQHHQMGNGPSSLSAMYGLDIKPKLEPGLGSGHLSHGYGHLHQAHTTHPMHHLSTMGMNFLHHSTASALPPPISSPVTVPSQGHLSS